MKTFLLFILLNLFSLLLFSQGIDVPENYVLNDAEDYAPYEDDVLECIKWLEETPINEEIETRQKATEFVVDWMSGSPDVSILIDMRILPFLKSSPHLLITFMGGWTERAIKTEDYGNNLKGAMAGLDAVMEFYIKNLDLTGKDKRVNKLIKLDDKGELEAWVIKQLKL